MTSRAAARHNEATTCLSVRVTPERADLLRRYAALHRVTVQAVLDRCVGAAIDTLREVAARSGYSIGYLSSAERGLYGLSDAAVTALARCYRATVDAVRAASDASLAGGRDA